MTERRYARLRRAPLADLPGASEVPDGGMCLSVFLLLEPPEPDGTVLLGRVEPTAPWWEIGGIDPGRLGRVGDRWMLPSRQLLLLESPDAAARAILREQLELGAVALRGPEVYSDPAEAPSPGNRDPHWDLHFVYRGRLGSTTPPRARAWKELAFVEVARTPRAAIARGQADVLALAGVPPAD